MSEKYQKHYYDSHPAFRLHHTSGHNAGSSTLGHFHTNDTLMLIFFRQGTGSIKVEGHHYDIHPGDAILLNPSEVFLCSVDNANYHDRIVLYIYDNFLNGTPYDDPKLFSPFLNRPKGVGNRIPADLIHDNHIDHKLSDLMEAAQNTDITSQLLSYTKLIELLVSLNKIPMPNTHVIAEPAQESFQLNEILTYLDQRFPEAISIDQIASSFGISKSYLSHQFKNNVGISLWSYVILRRLHAFNALIRQGRSIEDACWQVGFQNYSNFFRLYRKHMGMTPTQYKQQYKK